MAICMQEFLSDGVVISLPKNMILVGWGKKNHAAALETESPKPAFYFSDFFFTIPHPWLQYANWCEIASEDLLEHLGDDSHLPSPSWEIANPSQFKESFENLLQDLQKGEIQKAVPYLFARSSSKMNQESLRHCLRNGLVSLKKAPGHLYGYWESGKGVLGITPELLFFHSRQQPRLVHTMALAGTRQASHCPEEFIKNQKEQHEHQVVVQGICQALQRFGSVRAGALQILSLAKLSHLITPIELELNHSFSFDALVQCLHPTPALGAFPLEKGAQWLESFQKHTPRGYYGAPIGFTHPSKGLSCCMVGIRNVQWDGGGLFIGAGCGVVKESTFEKEWEEIHLKISAIRGLFSL